MELFFSPISAYSHKTRMAFYEKGVEFKPMSIDLSDPDVHQGYKEVYPLGKLPVLRTGGELIGESSNIIEWLDNHFQVNKLIPEKAEDARMSRYWDRIADQYITQNTILLFFQSCKEESDKDQARIETAIRQMTAAYQMVEAALQERGGEFIVGDRLSLADISLANGLVVSQNYVPFPEHKHLLGYLQQLTLRPSFSPAREGFETAVQSMVSALTAAA